MRTLTESELAAVSGGEGILDAIPSPIQGIKVIWGAMNGDAPGASVFTGTASGPTPGGAGGRYPVSALGQQPSSQNMPGGQIGRTYCEAMFPSGS